MATEVRLVQFGMGMSEGTVARWLKRVGEIVAEGEPLVEIEAEKVTTEMVSPASGVLSQIFVEEGAAVPVRTVLALIE